MREAEKQMLDKLDDLIRKVSVHHVRDENVILKLNVLCDLMEHDHDPERFDRARADLQRVIDQATRQAAARIPLDEYADGKRQVEHIERTGGFVQVSVLSDAQLFHPHWDTIDGEARRGAKALLVGNRVRFIPVSDQIPTDRTGYAEGIVRSRGRGQFDYYGPYSVARRRV